MAGIIPEKYPFISKLSIVDLGFTVKKAMILAAFSRLHHGYREIFLALLTIFEL
ncbi:hypothetical protein [Methyloglobulus sp.]|uniref:hypothetical protein n=1 Tax=Methyloglobulus sp. TaxID=2518622 RepID=UPI00398A0A28